MFVKFTREDAKVVIRDLGSIIQLSSITFLIPLIVSLIYSEPFGIMLNYILVAALVFVLGYFMKNSFKTKLDTDIKHALISMSLIWLIYPALSALLFMLIHQMGFLDSFFETMSAITTTGLSVMPFIDSAPKSLVFWRSLLSWIGGVGIVVLALVGLLTTYTRSAKFVAVAGREERLRPNLKNTVKELWAVYVFLTLIGVLLLFASGMNLFDSVNYSMSAISTTGMSTTSQGLVGIDNLGIQLSLIAIMLLGATSFSVHYLFWKKKKFDAYFKDVEFQVLILLSVVSTFAILPKLVLFFGSDALGFMQSLFHVVSALTCGGFQLTSASNIFVWDGFVKLVLIIVMFIGGSTGSTAGGIKLSRFIIFLKSVYWDVKQAILPSGTVFARKFEGREVNDFEIKEISHFILIYLLFIVLGILVLSFNGNSIADSFLEVVSAQSNAGISSGISHAGMLASDEIMLIFNMWVGRLEIIPVFSLLGWALNLIPRKLNI